MRIERPGIASSIRRKAAARDEGRCQVKVSNHRGWCYIVSHLVSGRALIRLRPLPFSWSPIAMIMQAGGNGGAMTAAVSANIGVQQYARARRIAWTGTGAVLAIAGLIGFTVTVVPGRRLDRFTADPDARAAGVLYLQIAGPFSAFFGAGQALYFASQGTGRMLRPVLAGVFRLAVVVSGGALAATAGWGLAGVFGPAACELAVIGIGRAACLLGPEWRPQRGSATSI